MNLMKIPTNPSLRSSHLPLKTQGQISEISILVPCEDWNFRNVMAKAKFYDFLVKLKALGIEIRAQLLET